MSRNLGTDHEAKTVDTYFLRMWFPQSGCAVCGEPSIGYGKHRCEAHRGYTLRVYKSDGTVVTVPPV